MSLTFDAALDRDCPASRPPAPVLPPELAAAFRSARPAVRIAVETRLEVLEDDWRRLELRADCTPFQSFDWLATWQRCIGAPAGVRPAIVTGRRADGALLFLIPLAIERKAFRRELGFLGHALCDYNAPLLAPEFSRDVSAAEFAALWRAALTLVQQTRGCRHDLVCLDKMPEQVGGQRNPLLALTTVRNPDDAYLTALGSDWTQFYAEKRSSATRSRERTKRKKLAQHGEVRFVSAQTREDIQRTLAVLFEQKARSFARKGVPDVFARPGHAEFFSAIASHAQLVHVSRLDVGGDCAAANLGLMFRGCYYHVIASHCDGPVARFGPGVAHLHELMQHAIGKGCRTFDFTIGGESYKLDWIDTALVLHDHVSGANLIGRFAAAATGTKLRAKRSIKSSSTLWKCASWLRAKVGRAAVAA